MRLRPIAALSVAALSAVLLAGCGSSGSPEASPTGSAADLCASAASSGAASDAITVDGEQGTESTAAFTAPLDVTEIQRTVLAEGDEQLTGGEFVEYAYAVFDATTGEKLGSQGYQPGETLPIQVSPDSNGQLFGCSGPGSRIVATNPATESTPAVVYVLDVISVVSTAATGESQTPVEGLPTVALADDGEPTVELPDGDIPTAFAKETLKKGDGLTVAVGDTVLVQYYGVSWDTGENFDKSWGKQPFTFTVGSGVVQGFSDAVVGETVGSQVLAVLPPAAAYGEGEINDADLKGQTLVFVVDILGAQHPAPVQ